MDNKSPQAPVTNRIKLLRIKKGITQQKLADVFSISRPCICNWEKGKRMPDHQTLCALSDYFGVSIDYLLGRSKEPNITTILNTIEDGKDLLDISKLDEQNKCSIKDFYAFLLTKQRLYTTRRL